MKYVENELTIEEMLADPIVQRLMNYDGISATEVRTTIDTVRKKRADLAPQSWRQKPSLKHTPQTISAPAMAEWPLRARRANAA